MIMHRLCKGNMRALAFAEALDRAGMGIVGFTKQEIGDVWIVVGQTSPLHPNREVQLVLAHVERAYSALLKERNLL